MSAETIPALLAQCAQDAPSLEAVVGDAARIDYAGLERASEARAAWLVTRGVNKGHRVGLLMENGVEWAINAYAVMRIGAVLVPLSTLLRPVELAAQLSTAGVRHLMASPGFRGRDFRAEIATLDRAALPSLRNIWWPDELTGEVDQSAHDVARALALRVCPADDLAVIFTSGSRQSPRGIIHTHGGAIRATAAGLTARCVRPGSRIYLPMPLFWIGGFGGGMISALIAGATLLTEAVPEPCQTLEFLARERATLFRGWPDQATHIASHPDFASTDLSTLTDGSLDAVLPPTRRAQQGARANLFGMTESFGPYCGYPLDQDMPEGKWGRCGQPFDGMRLRIVDPDGSAVLAERETGNIQIGGANILRGICGLEREEIFTPEGWYDTGDMGHIDKDGFLWFAGRRDDMVKIKGASVYPSEVESALHSIPGVARAFVTDIEVAGAQAIGAAVALDDDCKLSLEQLTNEAKSRLSAFKLPARWAMLASLGDVPRNSTGKIDKPGLQALLTQGQTG
ncbi:MAG: class I adenylate-forming enzyme family protein [Novosphingobium sp.]|nr:class I adenylate-forming enzyme family protein [Novosphingobium sp.]